MSPLDLCPCGTGARYAACCGPFHAGAPTPSPESTMRARYSAYALGETNFLFRSWHPRTRPDDVRGDASLTWRRLVVLEAVADVVEFEAHFTGPHGDGVLRERSVFEERGGRWLYLGPQVHHVK